jgi:uncharacterized protein (DUF2336 family)
LIGGGNASIFAMHKIFISWFDRDPQRSACRDPASGGSLMGVAASLIGELETAVSGHSADKRVETLRRVTDLLLSDVNQLNEEQIAVFDDVLVHLIQRIESKALAELSTRIAPIDHAPIEVVKRLARHDEISVAGPVLSESPRLTAGDLIEIAKTKGQEHLLAISGRSQLEETVTDVLLVRGNQNVASRLAGNAGARFSEAGRFASRPAAMRQPEPLCSDAQPHIYSIDDTGRAMRSGVRLRAENPTTCNHSQTRC